MLTTKHSSRYFILIWIWVAFVFILDSLLQSQYNIVFAYLLAHFLAIFFREKSDVLLLVVITSALTIVGLGFKLHDAPIEHMLMQRVPAILSFWAAAFFAAKFIELREEEQRQEGRFKALFEYANGGIIMSDRKGIIVMANPTAESIFGYGHGEMAGISVEVLIPTRFAKSHKEHRGNYYDSPHPRNMGIGLNLRGQKKDGTEFPVEISLSPFRNQEGEFVIAFVLDNTFRKNYEISILKQKQELASLSAALQELNEGLENKVAERTRELERAKNDLSAMLDQERELGELKSRFVSMASHEFRTPLTSIKSSAGLIQQYADRQDFENVKKHAERVKNAVNGLNSILTEFLSLGRLEEGRVTLNKELTSLDECIADVFESLKSILKSGQTFAHQHEGAPQVELDCNLTKNILINLISNAIKYSPENAPILIKSRVSDGKLRISVIDKGMGIPVADQKHLFGRFFRASNAVNSTQGTGLGLYIVQRYAEMMSGAIGFESAVEAGSTFWVEIPV